MISNNDRTSSTKIVDEICEQVSENQPCQCKLHLSLVLEEIFAFCKILHEFLH